MDDDTQTLVTIRAADVVVHVFLPPTRSFYNLEEFYGNAVPIELPFEQVDMER